jgi:hypothetical protein
MSDYRAYIFGKDGHRFLKIADFSSSHPNAAAAVDAARELMDGCNGELWKDDHLVCRFTNGKEPLKTLREYTIATVSIFPLIPVVRVTPRHPEVHHA